MCDHLPEGAEQLLNAKKREIMSLTQEQTQHFQTEGYVAVPDMFAANEVQAMLAELERFKQEGLGRNVANPSK